MSKVVSESCSRSSCSVVVNCRTTRPSPPAAVEYVRPPGCDRAAPCDVLVGGHEEGDPPEFGTVGERQRAVDVAQRHAAGPDLDGRRALLHPGRPGERYEQFVRAPGIGPDVPGVPVDHLLAAGAEGETVGLRPLPLQASAPRSVAVRDFDAARAVEVGEDLVPGARRGQGQNLAPGRHASSYGPTRKPLSRCDPAHVSRTELVGRSSVLSARSRTASHQDPPQ